MTRIYYFLILILFFACDNSTTAQSKLTSYEDNEMWGYKNADGEVVIKAIYVMADEFLASGIASVIDEDGWAYIDMSGTIILRPFIYDNGPDYFSEGFARFVKNDKIGFFDETGKIIIEAKYDFANPFSNGMAVVCNGCQKEYMGEHYTMVGGLWGYINTEGEEVVDLQYEAVEEFEDGKAKVKLGKWFTIDKNGKTIK